MFGRRPTAKGQGTEILSGQPQAVQIKRIGSQLDEDDSATVSGQPAEPLPADPEPAPLSEEAVRQALYEETAAAADVAPDRLVPGGMDWPPTPEMELALFEEASAAEDSTLPLAQKPDRTLEETMTAKDLTEGGLLSGLASAAFGASEGDALSSGDIQAPGTPVEPIELPERTLSEEQTKELVQTNSSQINALGDEINKVYDQVLNEVGENQAIATDCYNNLLRARDIVLRQDVGRLAQAEYYVQLARARLKRAASSRTGARRNAWWITIWGFVWAAAYVAALIMLDSQFVKDLISELRIESTYVNPMIFLTSMVWGGLGGVVAIWYSLFKHVSERDFDSHYNITYLGKPFFGLILGATVYMVVHLAIVSLGIIPATSAGGEAVAAPSLAPWIIYLLSWLTGFKENRVFGLVDYVMKRVFSGSQATTS